ncbi:peptidylprolyl isomerase SurA [Fluctibacter halophilus]
MNKTTVLSMLMCCMLSTFAFANPQLLDKVAVVVDQGVILESEIDALVNTVKRNAIQNNQSLPSDQALRTQAIERLIVTNLQMQMAQRMGIQVSDPQLEQTIDNIAKQNNVSVDTLREELQKTGISFDEYRENLREELITGEVTRANVRRRIYISQDEVNNLISLLEEQGAEQAEYHLGHILIGFPPSPTDDDIESAKSRAEKVLELLNNGSDFKKIAIASSSGAKALEGGDMGWLNINAMPTLFAEVVQGKEKGELIGPLRSGAGFHILKIKDLRGVQNAKVEEVNARHILIKPSVILSEERARKMLQDIKQQVLDGEADFAALAKEHSEDPGSATRGGELGWNDPNIYVPAFKEALASLEPGEYADPFRTVHGWHLVQLLERRVSDATDKLKEDKAYQLLWNRKYAEETDAWIREMRDAAYIEVLAPTNDAD